MEKDIEIRFSELRAISLRILFLVSEAANIDAKNLSLKTAINNSLGIQGDDWDIILFALYEKEGLELHGLNAYDYFLDEGQVSIGIIGDIIAFPFKLIYFLLTLRWLKSKNWDSYFGFTNYKSKPDLTIGDLITSRIEGQFVQRKDRKFKIICTGK